MLLQPNKTFCPFNFFRSSGDIGVSYSSAIKNILTQLRPNKAGVSSQSRSRPGCWACECFCFVWLFLLHHPELRNAVGHFWHVAAVVCRS
jgi:hypothetical protein